MAAALNGFHNRKLYFQVFNPPESAPPRGKMPATCVVVGTQAHPLADQIYSEADNAIDAIHKAYKQHLAINRSESPDLT